MNVIEMAGVLAAIYDRNPEIRETFLEWELNHAEEFPDSEPIENIPETF